MFRSSLLTLMCVAAVATPVAAATAFDAAIASPDRSAASKARDPYRHPAETLGFFGIKPTMTVVEISPAGGWYTDILAPTVNAEGQYVGAYNDPAASPKAAESMQRFKDKLAANPATSKAKVTAFGKGRYDIAAPGSADAVVSFRNVHNWHMAGFDGDAFKAFYKALKPGGILGIEEHRLPEARSDDAMNSSGYMKVSYVRKLAEAAGFKYVGSSEINANPKDSKDYPKGVWTLPPTYQEGDTNRAKYAAIGESDRMTLKFVKPGR